MLDLYIDDPSHVMARIFTTLDDTLKLVTPLQSLVLAFDGPAPFAKLQTQRSRRKQQPGNCLITPGTEFMNGMDNLMLCYVLQRANVLRNVSVYISGPEIPGEGELKIIDWIYRHTPPMHESILICGCDSDIILQAITLGAQFNCSVLQSGSEYSDAICNANALYESIVAVIIASSNNADFAIPPRSVSEPKETFPRFDIVLLFVLAGNDYLPKLRGITYGKAFRNYLATMRLAPEHTRFLYDERTSTFNLEALRQFCRGLGTAGGVALPIQAPGVINSLHTLCQRNKSELTWTETEVSSLRGGDRSMMWEGKLECFGKEYNTNDTYSSKRELRRTLAQQALQELNNDMYESTLLRQAEAKVALEELREKVKEEDGMGDGASNGVDMAELEDHEFIVSEDEYLKYVRESDVEHFLRGLLWVLDMYGKGQCADLSYTYNGRPAMTPYIVSKYLDRLFLHEGEAAASHRIQAPTSTLRCAHIAHCHSFYSEYHALSLCMYRSLSADATVCCVVPGVGEAYVPPHLRGSWASLQKTFFQTMSKDSLSVTSYSELIHQLVGVWNLTYSEQPSSDASNTFDLNQRHNQRRLVRRKRKEIGLAKNMQKLQSMSSNVAGIPRVHRSSVEGVFRDDRPWLLITKAHSRATAGYLPLVLDLPLSLQFKAPKKLPAGMEVFQSSTS